MIATEFFIMVSIISAIFHILFAKYTILNICYIENDAIEKVDRTFYGTLFFLSLVEFVTIFLVGIYVNTILGVSMFVLFIGEVLARKRVKDIEIGVQTFILVIFNASYLILYMGAYHLCQT